MGSRRDGGNDLGPGFDATQVYTFASNTWRSSDTDATLRPLPLKRGGMGCAVFVRGNMFVMGGETNLTTVSQGVYKRTDIYNVATGLWEVGALTEYD